MNTKITRIAQGYIRVSRPSQVLLGESLPAQRARLEAWARVNDYELTIHADAGISAWSLSNRPGAQAAIAQACKHHCPVVCVSLSRLFRNLHTAVATMETLSRHRADIISLEQHIDTTSATGRATFQLCGIFAELERSLASERVKSVLEYRARSGRRVGGIPLGFDLGPDGDALVPNEAEQEVLKLIRSRRADGASYPRIARELSEAQIPTKTGRSLWMAKTVRLILKRDQRLAQVA